MSARYDRLIAKLRELFQLDQPELDFGIYRILHARSSEITAFLENDLLPQAKDALAAYQPADKAALQAELDEALTQATALGANPDTLPKVQELRSRLENEAVDIGALEADVYDHLYRFFSRYYQEGDFISLRRYKEGVYAIPYEGEEVKLHWANHDQYYIKTAEYLRDYAFRLRPDDAADSMRVHFRLVDAAEGEHGNVKETQGKKRVFVLAADDIMAEEPGESGAAELVVRFEYRPATVADWPDAVRDGKDKPPAQKDLLGAAVERVLATDDPALARWLSALGERHTKADGSLADYSRLRAHLDRYAARNTFDYFIHKDLGGFLRRELDFYLKSEVMRLDDVDEESAPRVEQYLSKIKVIRRIALKIIEFLAQLEDFQKKLWLKKKFVTETSWCVSIATILGIQDAAVRDELIAEAAGNDAQRAEWVQLHGLDNLEANLERPAYSEPLSPEFVAAYPTLMIDTRHFNEEFVARLLDALGDLDSVTDGTLFHSENFQALSLMQARYREQVKCIYIDPPYNTGNDGFAYKDRYQHSSWVSLLADRISASVPTLTDDGVVFVSVDDTEAHRLRLVVEELPGSTALISQLVWKSRQFLDSRAVTGVSNDHEYVLAFGRSERSRFRGAEKDLSKYKNPDNDSRGLWMSRSILGLATAEQRPNLHYEITDPGTGHRHPCPTHTGWRYSPSRMKALVAEGRILFPGNPEGRPREKVFLQELKDEFTGFSSVVGGVFTAHGSEEIRNLYGSLEMQFPKPSRLLGMLLEQVALRRDVALDFFAGSGTTGHAVINLNREDGGSRKFILVEMGDHFETVLLPRLKKVTFAPEWKDGRPKRLAAPEETARSPRVFKVLRLESYEETLNNLVLQRGEAQQSLLDTPPAQGAGGMKEQYLLGYMLDVESRGSASLLTVSEFADPRYYALKVKRPGSDESREVTVDLIETFNWLLGLTVRHIAAPHTFSAAFKRDDEGRLRLNGRLAQEADGRWWFRTVEGETPDGRKVLVIWRTRPGGDEADGIEQDNLVLDEWFTKQGYSAKDSEFDLIYVNGDNNLENLKDADDRWKVRLIEEEFFRLMFDVEDV
ncbi:MAG: site-specific DNA-methyltransferase [Actinomycetota bacterium]|nr:site-specific DNA-methyltransferase [Actinomycetota bacterium]